MVSMYLCTRERTESREKIRFPWKLKSCVWWAIPPQKTLWNKRAYSLTQPTDITNTALPCSISVAIWLINAFYLFTETDGVQSVHSNKHKWFLDAAISLFLNYSWDGAKQERLIWHTSSTPDWFQQSHIHTQIKHSAGCQRRVLFLPESYKNEVFMSSSQCITLLCIACQKRMLNPSELKSQ